MKKRLLAISVASVIGLGAGVANAAMNVDPSGIGMYNIVPYYSVQNGNATVIHITNTDQVNGKVVKVRFRGAEWSDDVFDFTLFLSPGDIWTGAVTANGAVAAMNTADNSCTLPSSINQNFVTFRAQLSPDINAATREGYVEIITMADVPPTTFDAADKSTWLYTATKHVNGVAPCNGDLGGVSAVLNKLVEDIGNDPADEAAGIGQGMINPTPSLMTYAVTINVPTSKAFATTAVAVSPDVVAHKIFFEQKNVELDWDRNGAFGLTADIIFAPFNQIDATAGAEIGGVDLQMYQFDMPDMTTPIEAAIAANNALAQRDSLTAALQQGLANVEYTTDDGLLATTDVVFTQPTRRFYYNFAYACGTSCDYELSNGTQFDVIGEAGSVYQSLDGTSNRIAVGAPTFWDREEDTLVSENDIVISPTPPSQALTFSLKGEASVISINNGALPTGSLSASLTANNYATALTNPDGWAILSTTTTEGTPVPGDDQLLPIIGFTATNVYNGAVGAAGTNYGLTLPLRQQ